MTALGAPPRTLVSPVASVHQPTCGGWFCSGQSSNADRKRLLGSQSTAPEEAGPQARQGLSSFASSAEPHPLTPTSRSLGDSFPLKREKYCSCRVLLRACSLGAYQNSRTSVPPPPPPPTWEPALHGGPSCTLGAGSCALGSATRTTVGPDLSLSTWQTCRMVLTCYLHRRLQLHVH